MGLAVLALAFLCGFAAAECPREAQQIVPLEDFEGFAVYDFIVAASQAAGSTQWITWSNDPIDDPNEDVWVLNAPGGGHGIYINKSAGIYPDTIYKFVPAGSLRGGIFNFQFDVNIDVGQDFCTFLLSQVGVLDMNGPSETTATIYATSGQLKVAEGNGGQEWGSVAITHGTWISIKCVLNLDTFLYQFFVDGVKFAEFNSTYNVVGGLEFYQPDFLGTFQFPHDARYYADNFASEWTNVSLCTSNSPTPSASPTPSRSPQAAAGTPSGTSGTGLFTMTLKQASALAGVPLSEIAAAVGVSESNITVVSTSTSGGTRDVHNHFARASSCFDTNGITRVVTLLFADGTAGARLAALINNADGSVRTSALCIVSLSSNSVNAIAPGANTVVVDNTEYNRIATGLGVGLGVGLTALFALLLICFCCCLVVPPSLRRSLKVDDGAPATAQSSASVTTAQGESYSSGDAQDDYSGDEDEVSVGSTYG